MAGLMTNPGFGAALAALTAILLAAELPRARGTTIVAPLTWAIVATLIIGCVEVAAAVGGAAWADVHTKAWRYFAACGTLCSGMAVLGAKRPQDKAWQWVVLSLWIVLLLPVGHAAAVGGTLQISGVWAGFWAILIAVTGPLNYLGSRYVVSALVLACGQSILLLPATVWSDALLGSTPTMNRFGGIVFLPVALCAWHVSRRPNWQRPDPTEPEYSPCSLDLENWRWLLFRDAYGLLWELRIMARVNQTAELSRWPVRLGHRGFTAPDGSPLPADFEVSAHVATHVRQTFDSLLRRFERQA